MTKKIKLCALAVTAALLISGCGEPTVKLEGTGVEIPEVTLEAQEVSTNTALDFVKDMKVGWSLGNTFDATGGSADEMSLESSWCGVKTTKEMILAVKDAGFNTLRLPVSWHNHVDENYVISEQWLNRVQEVLDYAYDNGMYVILNIHHDTELTYCYPTYEKLEQSKNYVKAIWEQLSARFADYGEKLIFEGLNEPRLKGTSSEWWIDVNSETGKEAIDCINQLNQLFVDTVRASGGNNAERYLMVPPYCAAVDYACDDSFVIPTDTAENKIIVSVHAYTPYNFALRDESETGSQSTFSADNLQSTHEITKLLTKLYVKYVSNGIPVVIGEMGARGKDNTEARVQFAAYYIAAARSYGISCCWWDNNAFDGGEKFGLLNRKEMTWAYPDIVLALTKYSE